MRQVGVTIDERGIEFPWCGKVINTVSLDVKADISRYEEVGQSFSLLGFLDLSLQGNGNSDVGYTDRPVLS